MLSKNESKISGFDASAEPPSSPKNVEKKLSSESEKEIKNYDLVIIGGGLAGLRAAVDATKKKYEVLIIEIRPQSQADIRPQQIQLDYENIEYLEGLTDQNKDKESKQQNEQFRKKMACTRYLAIKDIQRFLMDKIDNKFCKFLYESVVIGIDVKNGCLTVVNTQKLEPGQEEQVRFKDLIIADGNKHSTADLIPNFQFKPISVARKYYLAGYFTVRSKEGTPIQNPMRGITADLFEGDNYGALIYDRCSFEKHKGTQLKLSIAMSVLDEDRYIEFKNSKRKRIEYLSTCIGFVFDAKKHDILITESQKRGPAKDNSKCLAFIHASTEADKAMIEENTHRIFLAGDTLRGADFELGHGGNDAFYHVKKAFEVINNKITGLDYNDFFKNQSKTLCRSRMFFYEEIRKLKEGKEFSPGSFFRIPPFEKKNEMIPSVVTPNESIGIIEAYDKIIAYYEKKLAEALKEQKQIKIDNLKRIEQKKQLEKELQNLKKQLQDLQNRKTKKPMAFHSNSLFSPEEISDSASGFGPKVALKT